MIPLSLQLKNFLSYGATVQEIDFSAYHLICLTGKNGHGKSALLDAITWSVWGQARKIISASKADDNLIRLGQTQMMVIFTFICNEQTYRIKREYIKAAGKATAALEFGMLDPQTGSYISLTDKTIKLTQQRIEETIRFSFESFTNSVFLRQSNANEFSKKSPKERKEILATILGLDQYELMRRRALEKMRAATTDNQSLAAVCQKVEQEVELLADAQPKLQSVQETWRALAEKMHLWNTRKEAWNAAHAAAQEQRAAQEKLEAEIVAETNAQEACKKQVATLAAEWRTVRKTYRALPVRADLEATRAEIIQKIGIVQKQLQEHLTLKQRLLQTKEELSQHQAASQQKHLGALKELEIMLDRLHVERLSLDTAGTTLVQDVATIKKEQLTIESVLEQNRTTQDCLRSEMLEPTQLEQKEAYLEKGKATYQQWIARYNMLQTQFAQLQQKKQLSIDEQDPSCPLCEQNLSLSRRRFLHKKMAGQEERSAHAVARLRALIPQLKERLMHVHATISETKKRDLELHELQRTAEQLQAQLMTLQQKINHATAQQVELKERSKLLLQQIGEHEQIINITKNSAYKEADPIIKSLTDQKEQLEKELSANPYDETGLGILTQQQLAIQNQIMQHDQLSSLITQQQDRAQTIHAACLQIKQLRASLSAKKAQRATYAGLDDQIILLQEQNNLLSQEHARMIQHREELLQAKGTLKARLQAWQEKKDEYATYQKRIHEQQLIIQDYQAIAHALSKDGVQALLIEEAIPEIEQEANALLSRLTENQAQLFIESLKDLKKGGAKETLDITIADQAGIRPYELFSGGEAFRIDFALRIAISKLLARRAGTTLQTLIIDEGFGSQDEEGLSAIMDVIHAIQHDFAKIIIISHLSTLKDQFPVHFMVEKRPQGSCVHVMQQG